jgi:hypothetical protein
VYFTHPFKTATTKTTTTTTKSKVDVRSLMKGDVTKPVQNAYM